jgi:hypothetical protein
LIYVNVHAFFEATKVFSSQQSWFALRWHWRDRALATQIPRRKSTLLIFIKTENRCEKRFKFYWGSNYGGHEENVKKDADTSSPSSAARMTMVTGLATPAIGIVVAAATG